MTAKVPATLQVSRDFGHVSAWSMSSARPVKSRVGPAFRRGGGLTLMPRFRGIKRRTPPWVPYPMGQRTYHSSNSPAPMRPESADLHAWGTSRLTLGYNAKQRSHARVVITEVCEPESGAIPPDGPMWDLKIFSTCVDVFPCGFYSLQTMYCSGVCVRAMRRRGPS